MSAFSFVSVFSWQWEDGEVDFQLRGQQSHAPNRDDAVVPRSNFNHPGTEAQRRQRRVQLHTQGLGEAVQGREEGKIVRDLFSFRLLASHDP